MVFPLIYSTGPNIDNSEEVDKLNGGNITLDAGDTDNSNLSVTNTNSTLNPVIAQAKISNLKSIVNVENKIKDNRFGKDFTGGFKGYKFSFFYISFRNI